MIYVIIGLERGSLRVEARRGPTIIPDATIGRMLELSDILRLNISSRVRYSKR
jgi:hypothetical protein